MRKRTLNIHLTTVLSAVCAILFLFVSCSRDEGYKTMEGMIWGTEYHITYKGSEALADSILSTLQLMGRSLNVFDETSLVSRINGNVTDTADNMLLTVIRKSQEINKLTDGAFDPTLGPVIEAWGFGKGHEATADTANIAELLESVGIGKVKIEGMKITKPSLDTRFNFSAIAKGYGCDLAAETLRRNGCNDFLIEIGGEIRVAGHNPAGQMWRISIDKPLVEPDGVSHDSHSVLPITDCGVATSGNYRNYHEENGRRYGHTIDPVSGRPTQTDVLSATVIAPTAMEADALATACMVMGAEKSQSLLTNLDIQAMLILSDNSTWKSPAFLEYTKRFHNPK